MPFVFAGSCTTSGYVDDVGTDARFLNPTSMCHDDDFIYVTEYSDGNPLIRRVDPTTAEVTTAASMPSAPISIQRHPTSGNFYIVCPGNQTVYQCDPDFNILDSVFDHDRVPWFVYPLLDETFIYVTNHFADVDATYFSFVAQYPLGFGADWNQDIDTPAHIPTGHGHVPYSNPGGVIAIGTDVYYTVGRFGNRGLYRADDPDLSIATHTFIFSWESDTTGGGLYNSNRQLHIEDDDPDRIYMAFGPAVYNNLPGENAGGQGAHYYSIADDTLTELHPGDHANGGGTTTLTFENDFLHVFGRDFVCSAGPPQGAGGAMYESSTAPYCIEVWEGLCEACPYEYQYKWSAFGPTLTAGARWPEIVSVLTDRDRDLERHLTNCNPDATSGFDYPYQWADIVGVFLNPDRIETAAALLEENDRALELHLMMRTCAIPFEYPWRWPDLIFGLFSDDVGERSATVALFEERDRALEDALGEVT